MELNQMESLVLRSMGKTPEDFMKDIEEMKLKMQSDMNEEAMAEMISLLLQNMEAMSEMLNMVFTLLFEIQTQVNKGGN